MEPIDQAVRKFVFDYFLERTHAPVLEEIAPYLGLDLPTAMESLRRLEAGHHLKLLDGTSRILMAFPFSAIATPYRVTRSNGRRYFANCAWDSIAFHPMLAEPIQIDSFCSHCGEPVRFGVEHGRGVRMEDELPLVQLRLPAAQWWNDITRTCSNTMVFLGADAKHQGSDGPADPAGRGIVTVDQIVQMSLPIYSTKLRLDYERPPTETIRSTFGRLGLTGPHWQV